MFTSAATLILIGLQTPSQPERSQPSEPPPQAALDTSGKYDKPVSPKKNAEKVEKQIDQFEKRFVTQAKQDLVKIPDLIKTRQSQLAGLQAKLPSGDSRLAALQQQIAELGIQRRCAEIKIEYCKVWRRLNALYGEIDGSEEKDQKLLSDAGLISQLEAEHMKISNQGVMDWAENARLDESEKKAKKK